MTNDDGNSDYRPVKSRSDAEIEAIADVCREAAEAAGPMPHIVAKIKAAAQKFRVSRGLETIVVEDRELPDREAEAHLDPPTIRIRRSAFDAAIRGVPRNVMTIAHEFGHIILEHSGHAHPRRFNEAPRHTALKPYEDPEHHAKVFAAAFLIPKSLVSPNMSAREMQVRFGVSEEAARIRHAQIFGAKGRDTPSDIKATIEAMKSEFSIPSRSDRAERETASHDRLKRMWHQLEMWPGKDPDEYRKASGFGVRWTDHMKPRSDYGWKEHHGQIRAYRDLESQ